MAFSPVTGKFLPPRFSKTRAFLIIWHTNGGAIPISIWTPPWSGGKTKNKNSRQNSKQAEGDPPKSSPDFTSHLFFPPSLSRRGFQSPSNKQTKLQIGKSVVIVANTKICAQSSRRPEIQTHRLKTREAVCWALPHSSGNLELTYASQDSSQGTRLEWVPRKTDACGGTYAYDMPARVLTVDCEL